MAGAGMIGSQGPSAPLSGPEVALNMEALLLELQQLNDQADALTESGRFDEWDALQRRRMALMNQLETGR